MNSFGKAVASIALLAAAAAGLAMSLCGGVFTFAGLTKQGMWGVLMISVPSLAAGVAAVWLAIRAFLKMLRKPPGI